MRKTILAVSAGALFAAAAAFGAGNADKGKDVFDQNCSVCHNSDSTDTKVGPGLKGLFKKVELANKKKVTDANVLDFVNKGSEKGMPGFADQLNDQEKADLIAYLKTL
jgi:mono/diheme cytochrome c family protein